MDTSGLQITGCHGDLYIKETLNKGKGLYTSKDIKKGETILEETPLVCCQFSWNRLYNYTACDYCLRSLETSQNMARRLASDYQIHLPYNEQCCEVMKQKSVIVKCSRCQISYCSKECYSKSEELYHKSLCLNTDHLCMDHPILKLEEAWKSIHYPPETASIMLIVRILAMIIQSTDPTLLYEKLKEFVCEAENQKNQMSHKLLGKQFKKELKSLYNLLQEVFPSLNQIPMMSSIEGLKSLLALIGMNGQGIGTSSLSQYVHNVDAMELMDDERDKVDMVIDQLYQGIDKESGQFLNCEGSGLYSMQSKCNHSCVPNSEVTFPYNNSTLVLIATENIAANEEIFVSYIDECEVGRSRHSRRKHLRENYLFECRCEKCELEIDARSTTSSDGSTDDE